MKKLENLANEAEKRGTANNNRHTAVFLLLRQHAYVVSHLIDLQSQLNEIRIVKIIRKFSSSDTLKGTNERNSVK